MSNLAPFVKRRAELVPGMQVAACAGGWGKSPARHIPGVVSIGLLLSFALPARAKNDSVPDWVRTAAAQTIPQYPADTNAVVLLDDTTYTVAPDGGAVEHIRHVVKILRPQGRDEATIHVDFDKDTKILSMNVWSIGPDGHEYAMKDKDFVDVGFPGMEGAFEFADVGFAPRRLRAAIREA